MKNIINYKIPSTFLISFLMAISFGCSKKQGITKTKIYLGNAYEAGQLGGIMIYGKNNITGVKFAKEVNGSELSLPNGNWSFAAIGWNNAETFTGEARCAVLSNQDLSGGDKTINLSLTKSNCGNTLFGSERSRSGEFQFNDLYPISCGNYSSGKEEIEVNGIGEINGCTKTDMVSYRVRLPEVNLSANFNNLVPESGLSNCSDVSIVSSTSLTFSPAKSFKIPTFNPSEETEVPIIIEVFKSAACAGTPEKYVFNNGLSIPIPDRARFSSDEGSNYIFLNGGVCTSAASLNVGKYGAVSGALAAVSGIGITNYICNQEQLRNISSQNAFNKDRNFTLGRDIDLSGSDYTSYIGSAAHSYIGIFNGNGHTITGLNINSSGESKVGLFGSLGNGKIENINITNASIILSNSNQAGTLVGYIGLGGEVENISANTISISVTTTAATKADFGGLIGMIEGNSKAEKIDIQNIAIELNPAASFEIAGVGGVIGKIQYGNLERVIANNITITDGTNETSIAIGGIVGYLNGSGGISTVTDIITTNTVINLENKKYIGGVVGRSNVGTLEFIKANSTIDIISSSSEAIGGIVGKATKSTLVNLVSDTNIMSEGLHVGGVVGQMNGDGTTVASLLKVAIVKGSISCKGTSHTNCGSILGQSSAKPVFVDGVVAKNTINSEGSATGGIAGNIAITDFFLSNAHSESVINGLAGLDYATVASNIGGLIGINQGKIYNSYFDGSIQNGSGNIGSLVGQMTSGILKKVYSNSFISPHDSNSSIREDIGSYTTGTISDCYIAYANTNKTILRNSGECFDVSAAKQNAASYANLAFDAVLLDGTMSSTISQYTATGSGSLYNSQLDFGDSVKSINSSGVYQVRKVTSNTGVNFQKPTVAPFTGKTMAKLPVWKIDEGNSTPTLSIKNLFDLFGNGSQIGSKQDPILITNTEQFLEIWERPSLMNYSFKLMNDLDFDGLTFVPVGSMNNPFVGGFFGNNKRMKNITLNRPTQDNVGVFRVIGTGAEVDDYNEYTGIDQALIFENLNITGKDNVGGFAGYILGNVAIKNIKVESESSNIIGINQVGGLIGLLKPDIESEISGFYNQARVSELSGGSNFGGLFGKIDIAESIDFTSMANHGEVDAPNSNIVGGLAGHLYVSNNIVKFMVGGSVADVTGNNRVGGIIGKVSGDGSAIFAHLFSRDSLIKTTGNTPPTDSIAGGIFGEITNTVAISGVYSTNNVTSLGGTNNYAGGLIGKSVNSPSTFENAISVHQVLTGSAGKTGFISGGIVSGLDPSVLSTDGNHGSTSVSAANMRFYTNVSDLDFDRFFYIDEGQDHPRLFAEQLILSGVSLD